MAEPFNYEVEFHKSLKGRIDNLSVEQKSSIKLIIEYDPPENMTYNKNGLFLCMGDLAPEVLRDIEYLTNLFEQTNNFIKKFQQSYSKVGYGPFLKTEMTQILCSSLLCSWQGPFFVLRNNIQASLKKHLSDRDSTNTKKYVGSKGT